MWGDNAFIAPNFFTSAWRVLAFNRRWCQSVSMCFFFLFSFFSLISLHGRTLAFCWNLAALHLGHSVAQWDWKYLDKAANSVFLRLSPCLMKCSAGVSERLCSTCESHNMKCVTWHIFCIASSCKAYLKDFSSNRKEVSSFCVCVCVSRRGFCKWSLGVCFLMSVVPQYFGWARHPCGSLGGEEERKCERERVLDDKMGKETGHTLSFLSLLSFTVQLPQKFLFLGG